MEAIPSSETSLNARSTQRHIAEDDILHSHWYENLKSYISVIVGSEHVDLMPSTDGQLTKTCKDNKYLQTESHWTVLTNIP
jgi:hypothetical protein